MNRLNSLVTVGALIVGGRSLPSLAFTVPDLRAPINDEAGVVNRGYSNTLNHALRELQAKTGTQIAVLTLAELDGLTIEQASLRVVEKWKLGSEKGDEGVLLLLSVKERALRIEVGQGLEGKLTDADSRRIISESIVPLLKAGEMSQGILVGVYHIAQKTNPDFDMAALLEGSSVTRNHPSATGTGRTGSSLLFLLLVIVMGFISFLSRIGGGRGGAFRRSGIFWGGGGFGRGGGGFGGGGGGFSGGGASGRW